MATLALSRNFLSGYGKLESVVQKRVNELADKFPKMTSQQLRDAKGIHLETHTGAADPRARTIRITDNFRGIVIDAGNDETYVLSMIGTHDETDRWMAKNTFRVNEATGALEIRDVAAIEAEVERAASQPASAGTALFEHRSDKDMTQLGIDEALLPALRAFTDEDQLNAFIGVLPQSQAEAAIELTGTDSVEEIYQRIAGSIEPEEIDPEDLAAAVVAPASRGQFHVFTEERELAEVLARPWILWPTYLHTSQYDAAYRPTYNGPARVTGGAGTGKTVVAMHRANALAEQLGDDAPDRSILFTTYTRNLAQVIEEDLRHLGGPELLEKVEVLNVDRLAHRVVSDAEGTPPQQIGGPQLDELWQQVADEIGTEFAPEFLAHEWEQVILAQGCASRSDYFNVSRAGRGVRLDRRGRAEVWKAVERMTQLLVEHEKRTWLQLAESAAGYLRGRSIKPYRHVIVDEAQDLHESQWHLLRAAVDEGPNDLFIVGDSHQRIYDRRSSLSKVGINIRGRSKKLRINYRTTHEILSWALTMLGEGDFDDLDESPDLQDFAGYHSYLSGPSPTMSGHRSRKEQLDALVAQIKAWRDDGVELEEIGVAGRVSASSDAVRAALDSAGIPSTELRPDLVTAQGVSVGTMHRMKGLEFRCVAIVDVDDDKVPLPWELTDASVDAVQRSNDMQREKCLLYVACTRARDDLWVGWSGKPSRFLGSVLDDEEPS